MRIFKISYPSFDHVSSYLLTWEDEWAVLIDCVPKCYDKVLKILESEGKILKCIFLTHGHIDHIHDLSKFEYDYDVRDGGGKIFIHKNDADKLTTDKNLGYKFNLPFKEIETPDLIDEKTGYVILNKHKILPIHTPGHTSGGLSFLVDGFLFTGDTLFRGSIGRTDLGDGNHKVLLKSIKKLMELPEETVVYPGHGLETTLAYEKNYNPYLLDL